MSFVFSLPTNRDPVVVKLPKMVDGKLTNELVTYHLNRFDRKDRREWRASLDADREDRATKLLTPEERARMLLLYPLAPLTHDGLNDYIHTDDGAGRVFKVCALKSGVPKEVVEAMIDDGSGTDDRDLGRLALLLAGIITPEKLAETLGQKKPENDKEKTPEELEAERAAKHPLPLSSAD
jgi:hypothetical protein